MNRLKHSKLRIILFLSILIITSSLAGFSMAESAGYDGASSQNAFEGRVLEVLEEKTNPNGGYYQKLKIKVHSANFPEEGVVVENGFGDMPGTQKYKSGDTVILMSFTDSSGESNFYITDFVRRGQLASLFIIFLVLSITIAGKRGFTSILGMLFTFLIILHVVLPKLSMGSKPIATILLFSLLVIPITFYLSHGLNKKTSVAIIGTFISLLFTVILSAIYVNSAKISGYTTDEASFLQIMKEGTINMRHIFLAGIIIGFLGVLDDITVSQSAIVFQLKSANKKYTFSDLYKKSMDIGKDHIASMINTLVLVYTGASLPLLLLFTDSSKRFNEVINYEIIASEVIRTLLGSIGLVIAVPITTAVAALVAESEKGGVSI